MLASLGDPHEGFDSLHIGGTNGKGSTAALADSVLRQSGLRTGLYTSPHLQTFAERVRIGGTPAEKRLLEECAEDVLPLAEREDASFFESATVLAFEAFRRARCDTVVAEVGLGGRLDATNVLRPRVTVITSVDMDHANYLGDTLEDIAAEKAGILKPGVPAIAGPLESGPLEVVRARAREVGAPLDIWGRDLDANDVRVDASGTRFSFRSAGWADGLAAHTRLMGVHQSVNAALAIRAVERVDWGVDAKDIVSGLSLADWPGRFETISACGGSWVLDMAHNPAAIRALTEVLQRVRAPRPHVFLVAILGDKPWDQMLGPLSEVGSHLVLTIAPSSPVDRRWDVAEALDASAGENTEVVEDFGSALHRARELAGPGTVIVTGSAHTVGDARAFLENDNERSG